MKKREFDNVISIGANCQITGNMRAYFNLERAYPFDWWITPFSSLLQLLENRLEGIFALENIAVSTDLHTVIDKHYNILSRMALV